jgi:hypothetical protein
MAQLSFATRVYELPGEGWGFELVLNKETTFRSAPQFDSMEEAKEAGSQALAVAVTKIRREHPELFGGTLTRVQRDVSTEGTRVYPHEGRSKIRPNQGCPCGSGKKFKKCCGALGES